MNREDIIEEIQDCGQDDIKYIFDTLFSATQIEDDSTSKTIEVDDSVLGELKTLLIELIKADDNLAQEVERILADDNNPTPADGFIVGAISVIAAAPFCALLTMHANALRAENPNTKMVDCVDIIRALGLQKLVERFGKSDNETE